MKKLLLKNKLKAEHKSDKAVLMNAPEIMTLEKDNENERVRKQLAQDALIYERMKCPIVAMVFCLIN